MNRILRRALPFLFGLSLVALATACKFECQAGNLEEKKPAAAAPQPGAPTTPVATPAAPKPAPQGLQVCARVAAQRCVTPTRRFTPDIPEINAALVTNTIPQSPRATVVWIAEDTGGAAPPNYRIASKDLELSGAALKAATNVTVSGSLSRPTKGWPIGSYRVEVHMDGKIVATEKFSIAR